MTDRARVVGLDVVRGVAVLAMIVNHVAPAPDQTGWQVAAFVGGGKRPAVLFVLVGGIAVGLLLARAGRAGTPLAEVRRVLLCRGLVLIALGLALATLGTNISVVLDTWGLMLISAAALAGVRPRIRWGICLLALVLGSWISSQAMSPAVLRMAAQPGLTLLLDWFAFGTYPYLEWLGVLGIGWSLSVLDLTSRRIQARLVLIGSALACVLVVNPLLDLADRTVPHTLVLYVSGTGLAMAVVGAACWLAGVPVARRVLWPLAATGRSALSIYTLHVVALAVWFGAGRPGGYTWWALSMMCLCCVVAACLMTVGGRSGPMERLLRLASDRSAPVVTGPVS